jgi:ATP-dependent Clp protease adaptor protein ClpS
MMIGCDVTIGTVSTGTGTGTGTGTETITVPDTVEELLGEDVVVGQRPWIVLVWDDPVNLMRYVVYVFQKLFGYSREKATKLMLQVHNEGKAVVSSGTREKCEGDVARLHAHGLWATLQREDQ